MSAEEVVAPQETLSVDGTESPAKEEFPEFYSRCCADLDNVSVGPDSRLDGMKAILTRASLMWDNGLVITVGFVSGTQQQRAKVKEVVKEWEKYANLKFVFPPDAIPSIIRISFRQNLGSWSYIGRGALSIPIPEPTMNFGWVYDTPTLTSNERGVILHEFGHAIGYLHEHQSPRRGERLTLNEQVIIDYYKRTQCPPWDAEQTRANVIDVYSTQEVTNFSAVDFTSIMMYFMPKEFNVQGITINPNYILSPLDKAFAFLNYPFTPGMCISDPTVSFVNAANTVGITGAFRTSIAAEYAEGDWRGVRSEFTRWSINQKALNARAIAITEREQIAAAVSTAIPISVN